ncbi:hypothetical protein AB0O07_16260 [Streptomyces sp. NPDC093085]|uniref:hypothetical protein n=1 Tax=Streptomyces sp. NPDC093085 TaxID=3155068 RepID=UPI003430FEBE
MSGSSRKEAEIRRLLDAPPYPAVPAGLVARAARRGARLERRRRAARRVVWAVVAAGVIVFAVWAWQAHPWSPPPAKTTPPLEGW